MKTNLRISLTLLVISILVAGQMAQAQYQNNIWYFGNSTFGGLKFDNLTGQPSALNGHYTPFGAEGCFVATNPNNGELMFYTSGNTIVNKNHVPMQNGTLTFPAPAPIVEPNGGQFNSSVNGSQSVAVIEKPNALATGECGKYLYFINDANEYGSSKKAGSIYVGEIDMNADGGLGAVSQQPVRILNNQFTESMYVVARPDNQGAWLILNNVLANRMEVYAVSAAGTVNTTPVSTYTLPGVNWTVAWSNAGNPYYWLLGSITYHQQTGKLAMAMSYGEGFNLYVSDFNSATGALSGTINPVRFTGANLYMAYSTEFSPSGKWLYFSVNSASSVPATGALRAYNMQTNTDIGNINGAGGAGWPGLPFIGLKAGRDGRLWANTNGYGTDPTPARVRRSTFDIENPLVNGFVDFPLSGNSFSYRFPDFLSLLPSPLAVEDHASVIINCSQTTDTTDVLANDVNQGAGNLYVDRIEGIPAHGTAELIGGQIIYTLTDLNFVGNDTISYLVRSDASCLAPGTIGRIVIPVTQCPRDYGDAPDSYLTMIGSVGASHNIVAGLNLGVLAPDINVDGLAGTGAEGDDLDGSDDEDGIAVFPAIAGGNTTAISNYSVNIAVANNTGSTANLCGWIDWNGNGVFDVSEGMCTTVASSATTASLTWPSATLAGATGTTGVYSRFRITTDGLVTANANGVASNGEVEDYFILFEKPLPVTLISFTAIKSEGTVVLNWETTQETNSDRFEIQRSRDGKAWFALGSVKAKGESTIKQTYSFTDLHVENSSLPKENLYRLKMIDRDGTFAYSRIRNVQFENLEKGVVYPNPVIDKLFVKDFTKIVSMRILDVNGKVVLRSGTLKDGGIDISKLAAGIHVVEITWPYGEKTTQKILIRE